MSCISTCYSFDDLFQVARGRRMTADEMVNFKRTSQHEKNKEVKKLVEESGGRFLCRDVVGTDGVLYTAFWVVDSLNPCSCIEVGLR